MTQRIRRIEADEGPLLRELRLRALSDSPGAFASTFDDEARRPADAWGTDAAARSAGNESATFFIEAERGVAGFVGAYRSDDEGTTVELVSMWVTPGTRCRGMGEQLVEHVVGWARETGARRVGLWVVRGNARAIDLYQRAGFVTTERLEPFDAHPCHAELRLVRDLDSDDRREVP